MSTGQDDKVGAAPLRCRPPARAVRPGRAPSTGQGAGNAREGGGQELAELFFDTPGGVPAVPPSTVGYSVMTTFQAAFRWGHPAR
jgi:hypothetical protein